MRRLFQVRMLIVLLALALIPAATLPFAERIRTEWIRLWEPEAETIASPVVPEGIGPVRIEFRDVPNGIFIGNPDPRAADEIEEFLAKLAEDSSIAGTAQSIEAEQNSGEAVGSVGLDIPRFGENP